MVAHGPGTDANNGGGLVERERGIRALGAQLALALSLVAGLHKRLDFVESPLKLGLVGRRHGRDRHLALTDDKVLGVKLMADAPGHDAASARASARAF